MNMSFAKRITFGIAALALPSVMAHAAEGSNFYLGGGLSSSFESTKVVTHSSLGINLTGGAEFRSAEGSYSVRTGLGVYSFDGTAKDGFGFDDVAHTGLKTSLYDFQAYGDIVFASGIKNLSFITGLSVNRWYYKSTADLGYSDKGFIAGPKLGVRVGMEYRYSQNLSGELTFQQTDLGSQNGNAKGTDPVLSPGQNVMPSWLQVGVKYHF